ncbi:MULTISPECIES: GatB/YqeY domain-containing protein [unclassified Colwellia]|uniref:GatB/YqeY domain-containing protein n=1 Tax=unclassified Colwellia TaxID=196834 RepID=UPI0015F5DC81|nr:MULTISPECIES: GatB/YqeY domain-containing protein [unclassified Colwellia]MBA6222597.1 GatB/YqeY domain-containing protein [Colwellia sp. MB3u-45]MBA6266484.1 GatB/YqeY domain-containing protein [Colwellia sp. MB3u-43]MBA6287980.1 GatB/YqeY domain-containing protein [Colwellia sp. MB3u-4]MBA6296873.1 GatB/YqeY domain-containing protein [Colwellia sp. MB02u-9]MBA6320245.1 GatB/YqeY domain-containing protein [Colwellia sp. MB02u-19]
MSLLSQLQDEMKNAMRAKDKLRLGVIRMALSAIKLAEIDHKTEATDENVIALLTKMVKQRKESIKMFTEGGRDELAAKEAEEVIAIEYFLPQPLSADEINQLITETIAETGAASMADMGKVMAVLKPLMQGKADMGAVSGQVRVILNS